MDPLSGIDAARRNEDIALDMMKFIASTTNYGKTVASNAGFHGGAENKSEDYARHLLELYTRCLNTVNGKRSRDLEDSAAKHKFALRPKSKDNQGSRYAPAVPFPLNLRST